MFLSEWREFPSMPCLVGGEKIDDSCVSMLLKSRASLTCFRACFLPGRAKDSSAPRYYICRGLLLHLIALDTNTHTHTHTWKDSLGRVINPSQRPLYDNTQHSQQTDIHATGRDSNPQASGRRPTP